MITFCCLLVLQSGADGGGGTSSVEWVHTSKHKTCCVSWIKLDFLLDFILGLGLSRSSYSGCCCLFVPLKELDQPAALAGARA